MLARVCLNVKGVVQGVGFRGFARSSALKRNLKGFVRNLPDGSVESVVESEKNLIEEYLQNLRKGPSLAQVEQLEANLGNYTRVFQDFKIPFRDAEKRCFL